MKKFIGFFTLTFALIMVGCSEPAATQPEVIETHTETVVVEKEVPAESGTSISLDGNGVSVESDKIDISVTKEK